MVRATDRLLRTVSEIGTKEVLDIPVRSMSRDSKACEQENDEKQLTHGTYPIDYASQLARQPVAGKGAIARPSRQCTITKGHPPPKATGAPI
jgi:hypothetical protein